MKETIILHHQINASQEEVYNAWLNSETHTLMTGGEAVCSNMEGEEFSAWDGYITGTNIMLKPFSEIIQNWRTSEFSDEDEDSLLKIRFNKIDRGTEITLHHSNIPESQLQYINGWKEHYFEPMTKYFNNKKAN
jgi:activator of HSP90 ATPase